MPALHDLPLLSQFTACGEDIDDPIETMYLKQPNIEETKLPLYSLEFFMGLNYRETKLKMSPNIIYGVFAFVNFPFSDSTRALVRSSIKRLLQEQQLALIPTEEVVDKLLEVWDHNEKCKLLHKRIRYTEVLPQQEYEYTLRTFTLKTPLFLVMPDGTRQTYQPPFQKMPHVRLQACVFLVISHPARTLYDQVVRRRCPWNGLVESKLVVIYTHWRTAPPTFARKPDWQKMAHPLDRTDDPIKDILVPKADLLPDLIPDTSSSTTDSTLDTEIVLKLWPRIKPKPETDRWVGWMRNIIDHKLPFADEVVNDKDKRVRSYAKEKSRPYEEVMRTTRASVRYAPYLRPKPKREAKDDISVMII
ncbi:hypothetical protein VNI00_018598 [Paramarasmius palmivorus]|uniref:Uncharacterized protein n=1 Tax=Paramarasmius palmivorus TaxID=297713 RepID=A0AAW0AY90_9AGAR